MKLIKAEFRNAMINGKWVKQWRDSEKPNDEWKEVTIKAVPTIHALPPCKETTSFLDEDSNEE